MTNLYTKYHVNKCVPCEVKKNVTCKELSTSKRHNSADNFLIVPKIILDLDIVMINLYIKFKYNDGFLCEENERTGTADN